VGGGYFENGKHLAGRFQSGGATFLNNYDDTWGSWTGWALSNTRDTVNAGYTNQYSAYSLGEATARAQYGVAFSIAVVELSSAPLGTHVTNTTYAALSMLHGDSFAKKFGGQNGLDPDWFLLTIRGENSHGDATGHVEVYLADYRAEESADDYVLSDWTWVDLSGLDTTTRKLQFSLTSSDNGSWGMNTPAYFALDNLTTAPEPGSLLLLGVMVSVAGLVFCRTRLGAKGASGRSTDR
jgi:hypothetical protein